MKFINKINLLSLKEMIFILGVILSFFSYSQYLDYVVTLIILLLAIFINIENLLYLYLCLSFFDDVLILDVLGGSISRIILFVLMIRSIFYLLKNKVFITKKYLSIIFFFLISVFVSIFLKKFTFECFTIFLNVLTLILLLVVTKHFESSKNQILENLFITVVVSVLFACFFGIIHNNYLLEEISSSLKIYRFSGTYEPNFMCLYIDMAIVALFSLRNKINEKKYYFLLILFIVFAGMTLSVTGLMCLFIVMICYFYQIRENKKDIIKVILSGVLAIIFFIPINYLISQIDTLRLHEVPNIQNEINQEISNSNSSEQETNQHQMIDNYIDENSIDASNEDVNQADDIAESSFVVRINQLITDFSNGNFDQLTSGRLPLFKTFVCASFDRNIIEVLFGNGPTTKMLFTNFFYDYNYSHNTYADLLYNFGVIGFALVMCFIVNMFKQKQIYVSNKNYSNGLFLMRILVLCMALGLSMYTKKMCLLFLFL